ncbi:uhpC, partial [Symbiodinium pilosum]
MLTGFLNIAFSFASTVPLFTGIWLLNGLFQGCGATPCNKMLVNWFPARSRGKWWSSWNASHNIGGFLIPLLAGGLAARFGWRAGMMGPGVIAILAGLLALATMKDSPEKAGLPSAEDWAAPRFQDEVSGTPEPASVEDSTEKVWESLLRNKFLWCMAAMHFFIYFIRQGVLNWAHFYIMDEFGVPALEATARVSGFELGGLLGCIVSGQVSDWLISRYPQRGAAGLRAQVMIAYSLLAAAAVFCLWVVPPLAVLQWISMAAFGFAIYGPQTLITMTGVETVPRKAAATAGGLLAYPAQLGSMCAGLPFALLVQEYGWGGFFPSLILLSLVSATVIIPGWNTPSYRQDLSLPVAVKMLKPFECWVTGCQGWAANPREMQLRNQPDRPGNGWLVGCVQNGCMRKNAASSKKRKWQEELSEESDGEGEQITVEELEKWKETLAEEEKREQMEKEEQERRAREEERRRRAAEEEERRKREQEEAEARKEAEEARKAAEEAEQERRRQEEDLIPPGAHPPDVLGLMPPGLKPDKAHLYKTSFCKRWEQGNCNFGSACHFAHGERELRGRLPSQAGMPGPLAGVAPRPALSSVPCMPVSPPRPPMPPRPPVPVSMGKGDWKGEKGKGFEGFDSFELGKGG